MSTRNEAISKGSCSRILKAGASAFLGQHLGKESSSVAVEQLPVFARQEIAREVYLLLHEYYNDARGFTRQLFVDCMDALLLCKGLLLLRREAFGVFQPILVQVAAIGWLDLCDAL